LASAAIVENEDFATYRQSLPVAFFQSDEKAAYEGASDSTNHHDGYRQMSKKQFVDSTDFVRGDRRGWRDDALLAPGALLDFQQLCDDAFQSLRRKYFRPADLIAEMRLRKGLGIEIPGKIKRRRDD